MQKEVNSRVISAKEKQCHSWLSSICAVFCFIQLFKTVLKHFQWIIKFKTLETFIKTIKMQFKDFHNKN
jgi:hypothetical protein